MKNYSILAEPYAGGPGDLNRDLGIVTGPVSLRTLFGQIKDRGGPYGRLAGEMRRFRLRRQRQGRSLPHAAQSGARSRAARFRTAFADVRQAAALFRTMASCCGIALSWPRLRDMGGKRGTVCQLPVVENAPRIMGAVQSRTRAAALSRAAS